MVKKSTRSHRAAYYAILISLIVVLPVLYGFLTYGFWTNFNSIVHPGWTQVDIPGVCKLLIPKDWSYVNYNDDGIDAYIYGPNATGSAGEGRELLFICNRLNDSRKPEDRIREAIGLGVLDADAVVAYTFTSGSSAGRYWKGLVYCDSVTGEEKHYWVLTIHRGDGYELISTADSVHPSVIYRVLEGLERLSA